MPSAEGTRVTRRSLPLQSVIDVIVRGKVQAIGDHLVARPAPIEARRHNPLTDGDVLVHHHLALPGPNDGADQVADRHRHLPPAFFPGANAARGPGVGELLQRSDDLPRHRTQRVADHVGSVLKDGKFLAPGQQWIIHETGFLRSRHATQNRPSAGKP